MEMTEQCLDAAPVTMEGKCCLENAMISNFGKTNKSHVTAVKKAKGGKLALPVCVRLCREMKMCIGGRLGFSHTYI